MLQQSIVERLESWSPLTLSRVEFAEAGRLARLREKCYKRQMLQI